jgi:hypothetical protein
MRGDSQPPSAVVAPNRLVAKRAHERPPRVAVASRAGNGSLGVHLDCCMITPPMFIKHNGGGNDQIDCCCRFCFSCRDIGGSNDARADSSAGWHDHPSGLGLRAGEDNVPWSLRVQSLDPAEPQVFAMDRTHLRSVGLVKTPRTAV